MKRLLVGVEGASVAFACGVVAPTLAQYPIETITHTIQWEKAEIAPGETNTAIVWATITPDIGTKVWWNSGGFGGGPGVLMAFRHTVFEFASVSNGEKGVIVDAFVPEEFAIAPDPITPIGTTGVKVTAGQFGAPANPNPNVSQSVAVLSFTWKAGDIGEPYDVLYGTKATSAKVYLEVGLAAWVGENVVKIDGQGGFTVTPAPATVAVVVPFLLSCAIRRRRP